MNLRGAGRLCNLSLGNAQQDIYNRRHLVCVGGSFQEGHRFFYRRVRRSQRAFEIKLNPGSKGVSIRVGTEEILELAISLC